MTILEQAVKQWERHCVEIGHETHAQCLDRKHSVRELSRAATFQFSPTTNRIWCLAPKCDWKATIERQ